MRFQASRTWAGAAAVLSVALAACAADESEPAPAPEPEVVQTTPVALVTTLRYCLAPELGEAAPTVATLVAALPDMPGDGTVELVHVPEADANCRFDNPDIDLAVASWNPGGGCTTTTEDLACMVRTLLVDLDDLGESTADLADTEVATDLRMQLDTMIEVAPSAPAVVGPPPVEPAATGCGGVAITQISPSAPTSYQTTVMSAIYQVDVVNCGVPSFDWTSSIDGFLGGAPTTSTQLSVGNHTLTFTVSVVCVDPSDPTQTPALYVCSDSTALDVTQGDLPTGDYCGHSDTWWEDLDANGGAQIIDNSGPSAPTTIGGSALPDLIIGNDRPNKINGKGMGDCLIGHGEADHIEGHRGSDWLVGDDGHDRLLGHDDKDTFYGGAGNDKARGGSGGDFMYGQDGDDTLDGNYDSDTIFGGDGVDRLLGGWDADYISGGDGNDCLHGGDGDDQMLGDKGADNLDGDLGQDTLSGGDDDDTLHGGTNDDLVHGNAGNDKLYGATGDDDLNGDDGDDVLCGGVGWNDYKNGGNHVNGDTCAFGGTNAACESTPLICPLPLYISC